MYFKDRSDAGKQLAKALKGYQGDDLVVFALPRGGVPIAAEIAKYLNTPLDLVLAHKIGHPLQPEYAIAAISESGHIVGHPDKLQRIDKEWFEKEKRHQLEEINRRRISYLGGRSPVSLEGKTAILVDDGIATGLTMQAAVIDLKERHPKKIVIAVPVSPEETADRFRDQVDDFIGLVIEDSSQFLGAVGAYYQKFDQVEDEEVIEVLKQFSNRKSESS